MTITNDDLPLVGRREGAKFIRETIGLPITKGTIDKLAMRGEYLHQTRLQGRDPYGQNR